MLPAPVNDQLSGLSSQQAIQLDEISLNTLRSLSRLCREFRQNTSATQRIQGGSPGAGQLGPVIWMHQSNFSTVADQCQPIFTRHSRFPGVNLLQTRLNELQQTLGTGFDDTSTGYAQRVRVLEKLSYENGTVRGVVDTIIQQHEYWKNKLHGQGNQQPVARRRLAFSDSLQNQSAALSTSATASGVQASTSSTNPSPLGSSQLGLGSALVVQPPMTSGTVALGPPPPQSRSHFHDSSGRQFGSGLGGGLRLGQQASSPFIGTGFATPRTTQAQPQRSFGPPPSAQQPAGINLSAPIQGQPSNISTAVIPSQPSVSADLGTATTQRDNILYIPRQPMNRAGESNNAEQESVASNDENAEEQSSSQKQSFSCKLAMHVCT